jgi:hypothetical protein
MKGQPPTFQQLATSPPMTIQSDRLLETISDSLQSEKALNVFPVIALIIDIALLGS